MKANFILVFSIIPDLFLKSDFFDKLLLPLSMFFSLQQSVAFRKFMLKLPFIFKLSIFMYFFFPLYHLYCLLRFSIGIHSFALVKQEIIYFPIS